MIDKDDFVQGMRRLAASVCLITTRTAAGDRLGLAATAVCSVSADPPTLLVCINRSSNTHDPLRDAGCFAVNVLATEDRALADRFASRMALGEKFAAGEWQDGPTGAPMLATAIASFDCRTAQQVDIGTHGIFFGAVEAVRVREDGHPLLYAAGGFGAFTAHDAASQELWRPPAA